MINIKLRQTRILVISLSLVIIVLLGNQNVLGKMCGSNDKYKSPNQYSCNDYESCCGDPTSSISAGCCGTGFACCQATNGKWACCKSTEVCQGGQCLSCLPEGASCGSGTLSCCSPLFCSADSLRCISCFSSGTSAPNLDCSKCCSGKCNDLGTRKVCVEPCKNDGEGCQANTDCCSASCINYKCSGCMAIGGFCDYGVQCCSGVCRSNSCVVNCKSVGESCNLVTNCCSGLVCDYDGITGTCKSSTTSGADGNRCETRCKELGYQYSECTTPGDYPSYDPPYLEKYSCFGPYLEPSTNYSVSYKCIFKPNISIAKNTYGQNAGSIYCRDNNYCYCYNQMESICTPNCQQRCTRNGCASQQKEDCCNNKDDDFDGKTDMADSEDCEGKEISLSLGTNDAPVCLKNLLANQKSPIFTCPPDTYMNVNVYYCIDGNDEFRICSAGTNSCGSYKWYYDPKNPPKSRNPTPQNMDVGPFTNNIYFYYADISGYSDYDYFNRICKRYGWDVSKSDVWINNITCTLECDSRKSVCEGANCNKKWLQNGEYPAPFVCCGDDIGEYQITSHAGGKEYLACCNDKEDCVGKDNYGNSKCYNNYATANIDGKDYFCLNGEWSTDLHQENCCNGKDEDFDGKIDGLDGDAKDCGRGVALGYGINNVCWTTYQQSFFYRDSWGNPIYAGSGALSGMYSCPIGYKVTNVNLYHNQCYYSYTSTGYNPNYYGDSFDIINSNDNNVITTLMGTHDPKNIDVPMVRYPNEPVITNKIHFRAKGGNACQGPGPGRQVRINSITCEYNCYVGSSSCSDNGYVNGTRCYYGESFSPGNDLFSTADDVYVPPTEVVCDSTTECKSDCGGKKCYYAYKGGTAFDTVWEYQWADKYPQKEGNCFDAHDNDCDGKIDSADEDCYCDTIYDCPPVSGYESVCVGTTCSNGKCTGKKGVCKYACYFVDDGKSCFGSHGLGLCSNGKCVSHGLVCVLEKGLYFCDTNPDDGIFNKECLGSFVLGGGFYCNKPGDTILLVSKNTGKEDDFITKYEPLPDTFYLVGGVCDEYSAQLPDGIVKPKPTKACSEYERCDEKSKKRCRHSLECVDGLVCCENEEVDNKCVSSRSCYVGSNTGGVEILSESCYYNSNTKGYDVSMMTEWWGGYRYRATAMISGVGGSSKTKLPLFTSTLQLGINNMYVDTTNNVYVAIESVVYNQDNNMVQSKAKFVECFRCDEDNMDSNVCSLFPNTRCAIIKDDFTLDYGYCDDSICKPLEEIATPLITGVSINGEPQDEATKIVSCKNLKEGETCTVTWTINPRDTSFNLNSQIKLQDVASPLQSPTARIVTFASRNDDDKDGILNEEDRCPQSKSLWSEFGCPGGKIGIDNPKPTDYPIFLFGYDGGEQVIDNSVFANEDKRYMKLKEGDSLKIKVGSKKEHTFLIAISVAEDNVDSCSGYLSGTDEIDFDGGITGVYNLGLTGEFSIIIREGECDVDRITTSVDMEKKCPNQQCDAMNCDSKNCKCDKGEGDCDKDSECKEGLVCCKNVGVLTRYTVDKKACPVGTDICLTPKDCEKATPSRENAKCSDCGIIWGINCQERDCLSLGNCVFKPKLFGGDCVEAECVDTDKGSEFIKGSVKGELDGKSGTYEDKCLANSDKNNDGTDDILIEYSCQSPSQKIVLKNEKQCAYGCVNGACLSDKWCDDKGGYYFCADKCSDYSSQYGECLESATNKCKAEGQKCCYGFNCVGQPYMIVVSEQNYEYLLNKLAGVYEITIGNKKYSYKILHSAWTSKNEIIDSLKTSFYNIKPPFRGVMLIGEDIPNIARDECDPEYQTLKENLAKDAKFDIWCMRFNRIDSFINKIK